MRRDFNYLHTLVSAFFSKRHIQKGLNIIRTSEISGWEGWLQVEFAYFLSEHDSGPEWWREWPVEYDYRKEKDRWFLRPDFIIRKKGWKTESYVALELKQHPEAGSCLNNMMADVAKVSKARKSELDIRSFWVLGVTEKEPKNEIRHKMFTRAQEKEVELIDDCVAIRFIPNTEYAYMLF